jgi:hypothetical protein
MTIQNTTKKALRAEYKEERSKINLITDKTARKTAKKELRQSYRDSKKAIRASLKNVAKIDDKELRDAITLIVNAIASGKLSEDNMSEIIDMDAIGDIIGSLYEERVSDDKDEDSAKTAA